MTVSDKVHCECMHLHELVRSHQRCAYVLMFVRSNVTIMTPPASSPTSTIDGLPTDWNGVDCALNDGLPSDFVGDVTFTKDLVHHATLCQDPRPTVCSKGHS